MSKVVCLLVSKVVCSFRWRYADVGGGSLSLVDLKMILKRCGGLKFEVYVCNVRLVFSHVGSVSGVV